MSLALVITDRNLDRLVNLIQQKLPAVNIQTWPDFSAPEQVEYAIAWKSPADIWQQFPNLKVVHSFGAGCDHLLMHSNLSDNVQVVRIVEQGLAQQMAEYVLAQILMHKRRLISYFEQQQQRQWHYQKPLKTQNVTLLGAGEIGQVVAQKLSDNGFKVTTWSRTEKTHWQYQQFWGNEQLCQSVADADVVVSILPTTAQTQKLLDITVFEAMPEHAIFINVGRGTSVNQNDLINALEQKLISGAVLDVFEQEPLSEDSVLWQLPNVVITPHISAITSISATVEQICDNYRRFTQGKALNHVVNRQKGY